MTDEIEFESRLTKRLNARAAEASRPFDAAHIARSVVAPLPHRRSMWLDWAVLPRSLRWSLVAVALAAVLGAIAVGGPIREQTSPTPAGMSNGWVAFALKGFERTSDSDIYVVRPGMWERPLIGFAGDNVSQECPSFSPDGTRLAYLEGGEVVVVRFDPAGTVIGEEFRAPSSGSQNGCPRWAPDSGSVAYTRIGTESDGARRQQLWLTRIDGTSTELFTWPDIEYPRAFDWSPDGTELVVAVGSSLMIVPVGGGEPRVAYTADSGVTLQRPAWSPDGIRISVGARRIVRLPDSATIEDLPWRVVTADGSAAPIEFPDLDMQNPAWSPDGQRIAVVRDVDELPLDVREIVVMKPDGGDLAVLAIERRIVRGVVWSPDGREILYIADRGPLVTISASGDTGPVALTRPQIFEHASGLDIAWQPLFGRSLSQYPLPTAAPEDLVHEFPGVRGDQGPGLYSWDLSSDVRMTKGGAGGISLAFALEGTPYDGTGIVTTVGGHAARMRTHNDALGLRSEQWAIENVGGRTIYVTVQESPGSDEGDLYEARAVVDSIFMQGASTPLGVRLVFRTHGGWSSD